jgi:hypothetical protein
MATTGNMLISKKSSPLKPLSPLNGNLVGSILGKSSMKIVHFKHGHHRQFLFQIGRFLKIFSETAYPK